MLLVVRHLSHLIVEVISVRPLISCCTAMFQKAFRDSLGEDWPKNLVLWSIIGIDSVEGSNQGFSMIIFGWIIFLLTSSFSTNFHDATENNVKRATWNRKNTCLSPVRKEIVSGSSNSFCIYLLQVSRKCRALAEADLGAIWVFQGQIWRKFLKELTLNIWKIDELEERKTLLE